MLGRRKFSRIAADDRFMESEEPDPANQPDPSDLNHLWQKDVHEPGKATCPRCEVLLGYGTAGLKNLEKRHLDKPECRKNAAKKDKKKKEAETNRPLTTFFARAKAPLARLLAVKPPSPIRGNCSPAAAEKHPNVVPQNPIPTSRTLAPSRAAPSHLIRLLDKLRENVELLLSNLPAADANNPLSEFSGEPTEYVSASTPASALWEELSCSFHRAFDYGNELDGRIQMVQRGPLGLDGALRFLDYFICERGLEGGPVEAKIEQLIEAVQFVLKENGISTGNSPIDLMSGSPADIDMDAETTKSSPLGTLPQPPPSPDVPIPRVVIDVDAQMDVDPEIISQPRASRKSSPCKGFVFPFSGAGKTASSDYPYGLHDVLTLPWTHTSGPDGSLTLQSTSCTKICSNGQPNCRACADLPKQPTLEGILDRAKDGVHENANYAYHSVSGLIELIRRKNKRIKELCVRGFNAARRIARQAGSLTDHKRFVRAIGSGKVENVDWLVRVQLGRKQGIRGLLSTYNEAAAGVYHPKSYTEKDDLRGILLWKLAGNRVADFAHRAFGIPSRTTLQKQTTVPLIVPSPGKPQVSEVAQNVGACFEGLTDVLAEKKPKHVVLMYDEIATEKRVRWDPKTNNFLGVCREHGNKVSLQFNGEQDLEELFRAKEEDKVHFAGEVIVIVFAQLSISDKNLPQATIAALGILSDERQLYSARPILISADCKKESGPEHMQNILDPTIDGVNCKHNLTGLRTVSLASDGETRRGKAFVDKTFTHTLPPDSEIYPLLEDLLYMDFHVGEDDLTPDKDPKHVFKRGRNRLLRLLGMMVFGVQLTPAIIRNHLRSVGLSAHHINSVLDPDDKQDVKLAYDLLTDIWSLPPAPEGLSPGFTAARDALRIVGSLFYHLIFPYVCVDFTLLEQLEHLSAAAHLNLILYRDGQKSALPTLLFTDIMIMIKNAYFCVAKAKLVERITGTTEIANIFAMYPHWDRPPPRRLQLPQIARDSSALPDRADHIKPHSWRGDTCLANVTLLTCWNRGRRMLEQEHPTLIKYLSALDQAYNVSILSPLGELIINKDLDPDDNEEDDAEEVNSAPVASSVSPALEDAAVDEDVLNDEPPTFSKFITADGKPKFGYTPGSTDRLKRVTDVQRYSAKSDGEHSTIIDSESPYILVSEPIATLVRCEEKLFLCIGEVTDIRLDSKSVEQISVEILHERKVTVRFHILRLVPATSEDDPNGKHDWCSTGVLREVLSTHGRLVLPVDPSLFTRIPGQPYYLFKSSVLRAFGAQLLDEVMLSLTKNIPNFTPSSNFPYRERSGFACFVCEGDNDISGLEASDSHLCVKCNPPFVLDVAHPQTVLTHMGAHILYDPKVNRSDQPCELCGRPFPMCCFVLKNKDSVAVNFTASHGCPNFVKKFHYGVAEKSTNRLPCSNVPLQCPACERKEPAVWRYNLKYHLLDSHPSISPSKYKHLWELSESETASMGSVWEKLKEPPKKKSAKKLKPTLKISAAHSSKFALVPDRAKPIDNSDSDSDDVSPIPSDDDEGSGSIQPRADASEELPHAPERGSTSPYFPEPGSIQPWADHSEEPPRAPERRSPSPLEYLDEPVVLPSTTAQVETSGAGQGTASMDIEPDAENELDDETHETRTDTPGTISSGVHIHPVFATTGITSSANTRRSTRKRKERDDVVDLSAALAACLCGNSAAPTDPSNHPNLYHLACLELGNVPENWVCEACLSAGGRGTKRRRGVR
ncbi:hypothetical protein DFH09DRAFT_1073628 [Mycena vulgaris]|nr:hypothetical protein DFH09DRAFT_1073628 [Mycena vulgaris]